MIDTIKKKSLLKVLATCYSKYYFMSWLKNVHTIYHLLKYLCNFFLNKWEKSIIHKKISLVICIILMVLEFI